MRKTDKVEREDALLAVQQAFAQRLETIVHTSISSEAKKKKRLSEKGFKEKMEAIKEGLLEGKRVPRGIFADADKLRQYPTNTVTASIGTNHDILDRWRAYVDQTLPDLVLNAWQSYQRLSAQDAETRPTIPAPERIRTCGVTMKHILRQDLPKEHADLFIDRLQEVAARLTNMKADLAAIIRALMLEGAEKGYSVDRGVVHLNTANQQAVRLKHRSGFATGDATLQRVFGRRQTTSPWRLFLIISQPSRKKMTFTSSFRMNMCNMCSDEISRQLIIPRTRCGTLALG